MCYCNSSTSTNIELAKKYGKKVDVSISEIPQYFANGFQFPTWRIITDAPYITQMNWGLVPHWFQGDSSEIASKTLNARIELVSSKPAYKNLVHSKRCIIPSNGFFEWQHRGKDKVPYFIFGEKDSVLSMAGLWDECIDNSNGKIIKTFTLLTQEANAFMAEIHNVKKRMPILLDEKSVHSWMNNDDPCRVMEMNKGALLSAHPVDKTILLSSTSNVIEAQFPYTPISTQFPLF
jgi:putative SOS response-associated peptidase YedK